MKPASTVSSTRGWVQPICEELLSMLVFREQVNQINSFLDASLIYGNNKHKADELRTFKSGSYLPSSDAQQLFPVTVDVGLLKTTERHLPPQTQTGKEAGSCRGAKADRGCFVCGNGSSASIRSR